jgi:hypothetical protein
VQLILTHFQQWGEYFLKMAQTMKDFPSAPDKPDIQLLNMLAQWPLAFNSIISPSPANLRGEPFRTCKGARGLLRDGFLAFPAEIIQDFMDKAVERSQDGGAAGPSHHLLAAREAFRELISNFRADPTITSSQSIKVSPQQVQQLVRGATLVPDQVVLPLNGGQREQLLEELFYLMQIELLCKGKMMKEFSFELGLCPAGQFPTRASHLKACLSKFTSKEQMAGIPTTLQARKDHPSLSEEIQMFNLQEVFSKQDHQLLQEGDWYQRQRGTPSNSFGISPTRKTLKQLAELYGNFIWASQPHILARSQHCTITAAEVMFHSLLPSYVLVCGGQEQGKLAFKQDLFSLFIQLKLKWVFNPSQTLRNGNGKLEVIRVREELEEASFGLDTQHTLIRFMQHKQLDNMEDDELMVQFEEEAEEEQRQMGIKVGERARVHKELVMMVYCLLGRYKWVVVRQDLLSRMVR